MSRLTPTSLLMLTLVAGGALSVSLAGCDDHASHSGADSHDDHGHAHAGPNPHVWLDPVRARSFVLSLPAQLAAAREATPGAPGDAPLRIVVTIPPVASLVSEVVGDDAAVTTLLASGASPHGQELTPKQMLVLGEADMLILVGPGIDVWAEQALHKASSEPRAIVVRMIDVVKASISAPLTAPSLPATPFLHRVTARAQSVADRLTQLDDRYRTALAAVPQRSLVTVHNAFDLLAERYDLQVVAHLSPFDQAPGADVTPARLKEAIEAVRTHHLHVIYAEPQFPRSAVDAIREATGADVLRLDPLGGPDVAGYRTYFELMESNLKTLVDGQSRSDEAKVP